MNDVLLSLIFDSPDEAVRAHWLWLLSDEVDLADPSYQREVERIAAWIESDSAVLREAVVGVLCVYFHVAGAESLAVRGWQRAEAPYYEEHARAVTRCLAKAESISPGVIRSLLEPAFRRVCPPEPPAVLESIDDASYVEWVDYREFANEMMRIVMHLYVTLTGETLSTTVKDDIDWRAVACLLNRACERASA